MGIKKIKKYRSEKDWKERVQAGKLRTLTVGVHTHCNMGVFTAAADAVTLVTCHIAVLFLEKSLGKINNACH